MSSEISAVLLSIATYVLWVLLPLVPAILIYRLFPNTEVGMSGPFAGLTLNAGGAFAGYFATLLASVFAINSITDKINLVSKSYWTLQGSLSVLDDNGKKVDTPEKSVTMSFDPNTVRVIGDDFTAFVPVDADTWPTIRIEVVGYGAKTFNLNSQKDFDVDKIHHIIHINEPVLVRKPSSIGFGAPPAPTAPAIQIQR